MHELLPLGSVVKRKESASEILIMGYYPVDPESRTSYTYLGVQYPFGYGLFNELLLFSEESIESVLFEGHRDERGDRLRSLVQEIADQQKT